MTHRRRGRFPRSRVVAAVAALGVFLVVAIAAASWTATGSGSGAALTGTAARVLLTPGTPEATLFPGGRADVALVISNPGTATVTVTAIALDPLGGFAVDAGHAGCDLSVLNFDPQDGDGAGWTVPGRTGGADGTLAVTLTDALSMTVDAETACQGAQFSVYLVAGP